MLATSDDEIDDDDDDSSGSANPAAVDDDDSSRNTTTPASLLLPDAKENHPPNPLENASISSRVYFMWAYPLVRLGKQRPLEDSDLATLASVDTSVYQASHLQQRIRQEEQEQHHPATDDNDKNNQTFPRLARVLFWDYWRRTRRARWVLAVHMASRLVQTVALGRILRLLDQSDSDASNARVTGYAWAALLVVCGMVAFPTKQQQFFETYRIGYVRTDSQSGYYRYVQVLEDKRGA